MTTQTITLRDYHNDRAEQGVVLFWVGAGQPTGSEVPLGHADIDTADDWMELEGTVDADGAWQWDGEGNPRDARRNTVYRLSAAPNQERWDELVSEYEES